MRGRVWAKDHPEQQRRVILDAARKLFLRDGIERVAITEIATEAGLTRVTLYQYFANKEEIAWALARSIFEQMRQGGLEQYVLDASTGYEAIKRLFTSLTDEFLRDLDQISFLAQFDYLYARDWPAERMIELEALVFPEMQHIFADLVRRGITDGSLRPDLDPDVTLSALINALIATQRRLAFLGRKVEAEYGQSIERMIREICRIFLLGLQASPT